jgi:hypothetical protein
MNRGEIAFRRIVHRAPIPAAAAGPTGDAIALHPLVVSLRIGVGGRRFK